MPGGRESGGPGVVIPGFRYLVIPKPHYTKASLSRDSGIPLFRSLITLKPRYPGIPVSRYPVIPKPRYSEIPLFRNSDN